MNIRSVKKNIVSFENYLNLLNHNFTVIGLSKTWLSNDDYDLYGLSGYNFIGHHRSDRIGGGVAVCLKNNNKKTLFISWEMIFPDLTRILNPFSLKLKIFKMAASQTLLLGSFTIHLIKICKNHQKIKWYSFFLKMWKKMLLSIKWLQYQLPQLWTTCFYWQFCGYAFK